MLLVHATPREVRAELSEPIGRDSRGYVDTWGDPYLFPPLQFESVDPDLPFDDGDFGPDFNINIDPR